MTTKQLYDDIRCMGFDRQSTNGEADTERVFVTAVNRAQETLAAIFPLYENLTLSTRELVPCLHLESYTLQEHQSDTKSCENARSFVFSVRGRGEVSVKKNGVPYAVYSIDSPLVRRTFRGEFPEKAAFSITFQSTDGLLDLRELSVFAEPCAAREKQDTFYVYRLGLLLDGALTLAQAPTDENGVFLREGRDYRMQNGNLYVSDTIESNLKLTIRRMPRRFDLSMEEPDVRPECAHLLPLLTAAYVWLDDDREKAVFYLSMYRESLSRTVSNGCTADVGGGYRTDNGW